MPSSSTATASGPTSSSPPSASEALESDLLAHLASSSALEDLHSTLLCSLQRMGWTERIRKLSVELMRAGRCERFDEVVEAVVASAEGRRHPVLMEEDDDDNDEDGGGDEDGGEGAAFKNVDVRIPEAVVEQGVRAIKEVLREVVVLEDEADSTEGHHAHHKLQHQQQGDAGATTERKSSKSADHPLKNGDTSPVVKKTDKKPRPAKQGK